MSHEYEDGTPEDERARWVNDGTGTGHPLDPYLHNVMMYGGAPEPRPYPQIDRLKPQPATDTTWVPRHAGPVKRKVSAAARIDEDGRLWLRVSVDGKHLAEVSTDGETITLEEEV